MLRLVRAGFLAAIVAGLFAIVVRGADRLPACDADNGGLKLPQGFCALVAADGVGTARHLAVARNGDVFVAIQNGRGQKGGIVALRDVNGDGKLVVKERFGDDGGTGIALRNGYLYFATTTSVVRYTMKPGDLKPAGAAEVMASDLPQRTQHGDKTFAFDGRGGLFVNVGAPSNACQEQDRRPKSPGRDPCPLLEQFGGVWRFDENRTGQKPADGARFATGLRQMVGLDWRGGALYIVMNNRDGLDTLWPGQFTAEDNAERPAEVLLRAIDGANFGWPYCYYDTFEKKLVLNPEYGGDGKKVGRCSQFATPTATFPGHWAPVDLTFYTGTQFPKRYQGGAFIAFHGSWNRAPLPQAGHNVTFVPFSGDAASGPYEVFADGFAGPGPLVRPNDAVARPDGVAQGPDGSLYIAESQKGRIWRVLYKGQ